MDKKPAYSPEEDTLDRGTGDVIELGISPGDKGYATVTLPESHLKRDMTFLTMMGFGFTISSSWAGLSLSSIVAITQGGTATLLYGILAIALPYLCTALTLAELISVYPTAGGQYHFSSILAPEGWGRLLAYLSGFLSNFAWISSSAGTFMMAANITVALVVQFDAGYVPQAWHLFLIYQAFNLVSMVANIFFVKRVPRVYEASLMLSLTGCFVIPIVCLIRSPSKQDSAAVWARLDNNTGWSDAMCFITGLVGPGWAICAGLDSTMHLVEEAKSPRRTVSRAIVATVVIRLITAILYMTAIVYCIQDLDSVVNTATGMPIYELWTQATDSLAAGTAFLALIYILTVMVLVGTTETSSRITWSLARDDAFYGSAYLSHVHPTLKVPVWSIVANTVACAVMGCLYLASTTAFNALLSCGLMPLYASFAIPAGLLMWHKRSEVFLPRDRVFRLGPKVGYFCNAVTIVFAVFINVFFVFPATLPVQASNMNYAVLVEAIAGLIGLGNWYAHARNNFHGPRIELHG